MNSTQVMTFPHGKVPPSETDVVKIGDAVINDVITNIWTKTEPKK